MRGILRSFRRFLASFRDVTEALHSPLQRFRWKSSEISLKPLESHAVLQNISLSACFSAENEWLRRSFSVPRCENWQSPRAPFVSDPTRSIPNHPHTTHAERPFVSSGGLWEWVPYTLPRVKTLNYRKLNGNLALSALAFSTLRASVSTYFISLPCCWSESNIDRKTKTEKMKKAKYRYHKGLSKNCNTGQDNRCRPFLFKIVDVLL